MDRFSSLAQQLWQTTSIEEGRKGKKQLSYLFKTLHTYLTPGLPYKRVAELCRELAKPYDEIYLSIIPEEIPFHYTKLDREVKELTLITIDCAIKKGGLWCDGAHTYGIGQLDSVRQNLLNKSKIYFQKAIELSEPGMAFNKVCQALEEMTSDSPVKLVKGCGGHGVGQSLHQGADYIYSQIKSTLTYPTQTAYTVEPVFFEYHPHLNTTLYSYFEETIIP